MANAVLCSAWLSVLWGSLSICILSVLNREARGPLHWEPPFFFFFLQKLLVLVSCLFLNIIRFIIDTPSKVFDDIRPCSGTGSV